MRSLCPIFATLLCAAPAAAQTNATNADVNRAADDAFGRRIGNEDVGLYNESEVRGFDLQNAGNYQLEGHYFARTNNVPLPILDSVAIRVGANGLRTDFAPPSGMVQHQLSRATAEGVTGNVEIGWWGMSGPVLLARGAAQIDRRWSITGGVQLSPWQLYTDGTRGRFAAVGAVPRWQSAGIRIAVPVSRFWLTSGTNTAFLPAGAAPPRVRRYVERSQRWMESITDSSLAGLLIDADLARGLTLRASSILTEAEQPPQSFHLLQVDARGGALSQVVMADGSWRRSLADAFALEAVVTNGPVQHRWVVTLRHRDSLARLGEGQVVPLGRFDDLDHRPDFDVPSVRFRPPTRDHVVQWALGAGYRLSIGTAVEVRVDGQKQRYLKQVAAPGTGVARRVSEPWLYSGAITWGVGPSVTLFASHARGIEEAGLAPANASNRGAVLDAVVATQTELGVKQQIRGGPSLIAGLFQLEKPLPGLAVDGRYDFIGQVRHRGIELSLAGPVTPRLNVVVGASWLDARLSGALVEQARIGTRPIGRPAWTGLATATWRPAGVQGLSIDGGLTYRGERPGDVLDRFMLPGFVTAHLGARQPIRIGGVPATVRLRAANLFNRFAWNVGGSGLYQPNAPRNVTLTLSADL